MHATLSIIIPIKDAEHYLGACIHALEKLDPPPSEVILVLDGKQPSTKKICEGTSFQIIEWENSKGCEHARNMGSKLATGDILLFLDVDVVVSPSLVGSVLKKFADPKVSALFGTYDNNPAELNFLSQFRNLLHHYVHLNGKEDASTFWTGCGAIRRNIFLSLNGFEENRGPGVKDIDLGYRLKEKGHQILLCKDISVQHRKRWTLFSMVHTDIFLRAIPWTEIILTRKQGFINDLNLGYGHRFSVFFSGVFFLFLSLAIWKPQFLLLVLLSALILIGLNRDFYSYLVSIRGIPFTLGSALTHWFYYFYSGVGFVLGVAKLSLR